MGNKKLEEAKIRIIELLSNLELPEAIHALDFAYSVIQKNAFTENMTGRKSKIELDRELYEFILNLDLEFSAQKTVRSMCIAKFGLERAPSRTALSRMWKRLLCAKQKDKKQC